MDQNIPSISPRTLETRLEAATPPHVIDVRKEQAYGEDTYIVAGAERLIGQNLLDWAATAAANPHPIVVYCVHGHEVSQAAATLLNDHGHDAVYLEGGIEDWKLLSLPTQHKVANKGA